MKRLVLFVFLAAAAFLLEAKIVIFGIRPGVTVLLAYYIGLKGGAVRGLLFGMVLGFLADSLSGGMLGPQILGKGAAGFFASYMAGGIFVRWTPLLGLMGVFSLTALDGLAAFSAMAFFSSASLTFRGAALAVMGQSALNAAAGLFMRPDEK